MRNFIFKNKHFVVLMGNGVTSIIGMGMAYIVYHYLPVAEAGIWFFMQSLVGLCEAGRYGLLSTATVKFYAGTEGETSANVLGSIWYLAIGLSGIIMLINAGALFIMPFTTNFELELCVKWVGINYLSSLPADVVFWRLQADEEYTKMFWFRMINSCSTMGSFVILALLHQFTLENVILWNFLTNCSSSLIGLIWYRSGIQYIGRRSKERIMEIFHFGKYTFGTTLFSSCLGNADIWILNFILGPTAVAIYNLAMKLMAFVELPLRTFATTAMSEMAIAINTNNRELLNHTFKKYTGMLTIAFIPVAVIALFVANYLIQILGGHHFEGVSGGLAANTYRLTMILAVCYPLDRFNGLALDITHHTRINFLKMVLVITTKIVAGLIFTEWMNNLYGIVVANYLATIISIIYGYYQLRKFLPHTIPGIIGTGYSELLSFISRKYQIVKKKQ